MSKPIAIGICLSPDKVAQLAPGFDYVELALAATLNPLADDAAYAPQQPALAALRPPVRAFNIFVPREVKVVGPEVDWALVERYVERALRRAASLGADVIVFGSGGARRVPEDYPTALAWGQLVRFLNLCADYAANQAITIAIEPLNKGECNIINSYLEGVQLAKDVGRREVRVLADIYHFMMEGEPVDDIAKEPEWLAHVHLSDTDHYWPGSGTYPLERLFAILKELNYQGMASIECRWGPDFTEETARSLRFLRGLAEG